MYIPLPFIAALLWVSSGALFTIADMPFTLLGAAGILTAATSGLVLGFWAGKL